MLAFTLQNCDVEITADEHCHYRLRAVPLVARSYLREAGEGVRFFLNHLLHANQEKRMNITIMSQQLKTAEWKAKFVKDDEVDREILQFNENFSYFELKETAAWPDGCTNYLDFKNPDQVSKTMYVITNQNNDLKRYVVNFYRVCIKLLLAPCIDVSLFIGY